MVTSKSSILYISVYDPIWGNTPHWALKLHVSDAEVYYLQVFGEHGTFEFNETTRKDPVIAPHRESIRIWELAQPDVERVRQTAKSVFIDNDTVMWNCQDWCLDVLRELEDDLVIGVDDNCDEEDLAEWKRLKKRLLQKMGPEL